MTPAEKAQLSEELSAYLDGELEPPRSLEVEALLTESREVRDMLHEHRRVSQKLQALPRMSAPIDLAAMVCDQIDPDAIPAPAKRALPGAARFYIGGIGAAAAVLLMGVSYWGLRPSAPFPAPPPADTDLLASAMRESDEVEQQWVAVTPDELKALEAVGYVGGMDDGDDAIAFADTIDRAEPIEEVEAAAPLVGTTVVAMGGDDSSVIDGSTEPAAGDTLAVASAPPVPLVQVTVQAANEASFQQTLAVASAGLKQRIASGERQDFAGDVTPEAVSPLLRALEEASPDGVQITMNFAPDEMDQVRAILRASPSPAAPAADAHTSPTVRENVTAARSANQVRKDVFFHRGAPLKNDRAALRGSARQAGVAGDGVAGKKSESDARATRGRSQPATNQPVGEADDAADPVPSMAAQAQLLHQVVPGFMTPWMQPLPPQFVGSRAQPVVSLGITILAPPAESSATSRPIGATQD